MLLALQGMNPVLLWRPLLYAWLFMLLLLCHCHFQVTYREFAYGHMDFTFSMKDELRYYVMQCLNRK